MLGFYYEKVEKNLCTQAELESACKALQENMDIYGTAADFARYYGVPEGSIRAAISRKLIAKPVRKVFYPFHKFREVVPASWRRKRNKQE